MPHTTDIRVRYGETDQAGVVYHAHFLNYLEVGRTEYLRACGLAYRELEKRGVFLVVVEARVRYRAPARYDDVLQVETQVEDVGRASVTFASRIVRPADEKLIAEGQVVLACLDSDRRPRALPEDVVAAIARC